MKKHMSKLWIATVFLLLASVAGTALRDASAGDRAQLKREVQRLHRETQGFQDLFRKSIELVMPSVVSISTTRTVRAPALGGRGFEMPMPTPNPFSPFERRRPSPPSTREYKTPGLGSGFVIRADGYIVTNYHVVEDTKAEDIKVIFNDGREFTAENVTRDANTEVAVIKIAAKGLLPLDWGDSRKLRAGDWVIAIGSPLGFGSTATTGIVSATSTKDRVIAAGERHDLAVIRRRTGYAIEDYVQTDAAINPGNSGGPLVTLTGEVVGINTLIVSSTRTSAGLGFAVPQKIAQKVVNELISRGRVVRGHLGVSIIAPADINDKAAWELFQMRNADEVLNTYRIRKDDKGTLVASLLSAAPAEKAGIEVGDLITAVGNTPVPDTDTLRQIIAARQPGTKLTITVMRKGREKKISVLLGEQPAASVAEAAAGNTFNQADLGATVQTLTPDVAAALGYERALPGVVVTDVDPNSAAARAGLQVNDVIQNVNRTPVRNVKEFEAAMRALDKKGAALRVKRGDTTQYLSVSPSEKRD